MHQKARFGGSQDAAFESLFDAFVGPSTASRFSGSFAKSCLFSCDHCCAPLCHESPRATTWSICTSVDVLVPRTKSMLVAVYGSFRSPDNATQPKVPSL